MTVPSRVCPYSCFVMRYMTHCWRRPRPTPLHSSWPAPAACWRRAALEPTCHRAEVDLCPLKNAILEVITGVFFNRSLPV